MICQPEEKSNSTEEIQFNHTPAKKGKESTKVAKPQV